MVTCNIDGKILYHKIMEKLDNQKMFLFNKKCCKYFCDSIFLGFIEVHWDLTLKASHTLCAGNAITFNLSRMVAKYPC